jgi:hypothetical protein
MTSDPGDVPSEADLRAQARALFEKSKARGVHNYDENGRGPRKSSLILSAWYLRLNPDANASVLAAPRMQGSRQERPPLGCIGTSCSPITWT